MRDSWMRTCTSTQSDPYLLWSEANPSSSKCAMRDSGARTNSTAHRMAILVRALVLPTTSLATAEPYSARVMVIFMTEILGTPRLTRSKIRPTIQSLPETQQISSVRHSKSPRTNTQFLQTRQRQEEDRLLC